MFRNLEQFLPLGLAAAYLVVAVGGRVALQLRRFGGSGLAPARSWRDRLVAAELVLLGLAIGALAVLRVVRPEALGLLGGVGGRALSALGAAVALLALPLLVAAQLDLGASWRIGIERGAAPGLVTAGAYRHSRNPIFGCMLVALAGFALLLPGLPALLVALLGARAIRAQVREEEAYLLGTYGEAYRAYAARVGRFLPGVGRGLEG